MCACVRACVCVRNCVQTLSQFLVHGANSAALQCEDIQVIDAPAFAHRGLAIDSARRFYPVELIKQVCITFCLSVCLSVCLFV